MLTKSDQRHVAKLEASELDRLRAVNAELLAALTECLGLLDGMTTEDFDNGADRLRERIRALVAKAGQL